MTRSPADIGIAKRMADRRAPLARAPLEAHALNNGADRRCQCRTTSLHIFSCLRVHDGLDLISTARAKAKAHL